MSEQLPNPRLENFDANKVAHEQVAYEEAMYGEAGKTDFSDEARRRLEEADEYQQHLAGMAERGDEYDVTEDESYKDTIDRQIAADPGLRRMEMMARHIAEVKNTPVSLENADRLPGVLQDKEDKLEELLIKFDETSTLDSREKEDIMNRLMNMSEGTANLPASAEGKNASASEDVEVQEDTATEEVVEGEPVNSENNETLVEKLEAYKEFHIGDTVSVKRTSGTVEDDWRIASIAKSQDDEVLIRVNKAENDNIIYKVIPYSELLAMQAEVTGDNSDDGEPNENLAHEGESLEEYEARQGIDVAEAVDKDETERLDPAVEVPETLNELELAESVREMYRPRTRMQRLRNFLTPAGFAAEIATLGVVAKEKLSRHKKAAVAIGVLAVGAGIATAWYLRQNGHESGSSNGTGLTLGDTVDSLPNPADQTSATAGSGTGDLLGQSFTVEPGHGYTHELMDFASVNHHDLSPEKAFELHTHLVDKFGPDYIDINGSGSDIYTQGGDIRLADVGKAQFSDNVAAEIQKTLGW
ncbi:MAG: hypothetical protein ACSLEY_00700 [Candidatus Saccharimonadales bacterium]